MVDAILQAAAEVFAELGYARATTNKIARRAGVSVGSLYQYFPTKDSLLLEIYGRHHADVHRLLEAALARLVDPATPLEEGLRLLLTELVELHQTNPALTRALSPEIIEQSAVLKGAFKNDDEDYLEAIVHVLSSRPDVRPGDHRAMALVVGQAAEQLVRWLVHETAPVPLLTLLEELVQLLHRYLAASG